MNSLEISKGLKIETRYVLDCIKTWGTRLYYTLTDCTWNKKYTTEV